MCILIIISEDIMSKIVFFENNTESKICFFLLERFKYYYNSPYYCIEYDKECYEDSSNKLYYDKIDRMIKFCSPEHNYYLFNVYLLNTSKADSEKVINETKKYVCKDITIEDEELSKFSSREIVRFNSEDFTNFTNFRKLVDDYFMQNEVRKKDIFYSRFTNILTEELEDMLKKKNIEYIFYEYISYARYRLLSENQVRDFIFTTFANALTDELKSLLDKKGVKMAKS